MQILYRGKRIDNGEWVEGYYSELTAPSIGLAFLCGGEYTESEDTVSCIIHHRLKQSSCHSPGNPVCIVEQDIYEVDPKTVGQYTGLEDMNGKKIFNGDIVERITSCREQRCEIGFIKGSFRCISLRYETPYIIGAPTETLEIIGNATDNPELLEA